MMKMEMDSIEEHGQQNGQDNCTDFNVDMELKIKINSPTGKEPHIYPWPLEKPMEPHDIVAKICLIVEDIHDIKSLIDSILFDMKDNCWTFEKLVYLCDTYNKAIESLLLHEKQAGTTRLNKKASNEMIKLIIDEVYRAVVTSPDELKRYKQWSPAVYGETRYSLVFQMIDQIAIHKNDIFIDLGSGIGNVVLQMAASLTCQKCIGVEKEDIPAGYAKNMDQFFRERMEWYGKAHGDFELIHGDFLLPEIRSIINESSIIFVNNFAFGPALNLELSLIFKDMGNGTKIVSSNKFCSLNLKMNKRNVKDTGAIMHVAELKPKFSSVSWTDKPVSYFFHVIDDTKLNNYYENASNKEFNKAEMIMELSQCFSMKKVLLSKVCDLKKELEEQVSRNFELKRKILMNKLEEQLYYNPIEQSKQLVEDPTAAAVEIQREECIKERVQEIMSNSKGHHQSRSSKINNPFSPASSFKNKDDDLIHETEMFLSVQKIVESQSFNNESEREKIQKSVMITKILSRQTKEPPVKSRYLKDVSGKLRELSPDIAEGHKYYSKMKHSDEKKKGNGKRKLKKEINRTHNSAVNQNASRKQKQKQQQHSAALHRMILHKKTPKNGNRCDLIENKKLVVTVKKLKWTNQPEM